MSRLLERALARPGALPEGDLRVLSAGKAATSLTATIVRLRGGRIRAGLVVGAPPDGLPGMFEAIRGTHPTPGPESEQAGRRALALAGSRSRGETLLVLLSGGASAMMAVPAEGVTLEDKRRATERLLTAGADIYALNTVRKHLSGIKGGWLAAHVGGPSTTFAISDVVGDDLSVIASGPTVADGTTFEDAVAILRRFGGLDAYPESVVSRLVAGAHGNVPETPKPGDPRLARAVSVVIGGRRDAMAGASAEAAIRGYQVLCIDEPVTGEARIAAASHLRSVSSRMTSAAPLCIVSSGETTVHVTGRGTGGRNQEFALAAAEPLAALDRPAALASIGTDGIDGPTDAAGAVVDSTTVDRARAAGVGSPATFLADNNAYAFFHALGDLVQTGPTDTNVGDLQIVLIG